MADENVATIRAMTDAFNRRDLEALTAFLADDVEILPVRAAFEDAAYRGPDAGAQWFAAVSESWQELTGAIEEVRDYGDRALTFGRILGRGRMSGAPVDVEAVTVAHFRDGLITRLQFFTSRSEALEAAGLSE